MPLSQTLPTVLFESQLLSRICICVPQLHYTVIAIDTGLCSKPYLFWHEISNRFCHYSDPLRLFSLIAGVIGTCCITHNFLGLIYHGVDGYSCNGLRTPHSKEYICIMHLGSSTGNQACIPSLKEYWMTNNSSLHKFSQPFYHGLLRILVPMES